ncbi:MaoC/PaaZ C-terminal domain-containing protein [Xanthobacter sp. AM11]|uniref:MaoC/PaaZ C-terminal domain-containing protein n=1 Tax=Xanthobacter sp. AM11 TaxID=3380643 RepID=UPI0039BFE700
MAGQEQPGKAGRQEIGRFTFTAQEIVRFAAAFDPQPFHLDAAAAQSSPFGGLVASGWHTVCVWMGLFVRAHGPATHALPPAHPAAIAPVGVGFGMTGLKWPAPVRAGDTIVFFTEILDMRPSGSRPGWSILHRRNTAGRADGTPVLAFELKHMAPDGGGI